MGKKYADSPLKMARLRANMRQLDLARAVGVSEAMISKIETGRVSPNPVVAERIEKILGISAVELQMAQ